MDAGIAAIGGALVGALATLGTAALTTWAQRETARATVRADYQKEVREPRRTAYKKLISTGMELAESAAGDQIWNLEEPIRQAMNLKVPIEESWLEVTLLGPVEALTDATEVKKSSYVVFGHLWSLKLFQKGYGEPDDEEEFTDRLVNDLDTAAKDLMDAVMNLSRTAQRVLENTGLERK